MKKIGLRVIFALACVALIASFAMPALGQSKSLEWTRLDADVTVLQNGDLQVKETNVIHFTSGTFTFGYRDIDMQRIDNITGVSVTENGQPLKIETGMTGTNKYRIKYYFSTAQNQTRTFVINYTAQGATRYYAGGDQVYWTGVYADRSGFAAQNSKLTITLPSGATASEIGAYGPRASVTGKGESVVVATASESIPSGQEFEIRAQFPHGVITGSAPAWQAAYDKQRDYAQNTQPKIDLGFLLSSLLLAIGGPAAAIFLYVTRGKDPNVGLVADYLTEPPDIAPGVGGTLVDEKADLQDIIATLVDLARRGVLTMSEGQPDKQLGFATREYTFGTGPQFASAQLSAPEGQLVKAIGLSQSNESVGLGEIKNRFYTKIPGLKRALYQELQTQGLYNHNPETVRNSYSGMGWAIIVFGILSACLFFFVAAALSGLALCLPVGFIISGVAVLIIAPKMPLRTRKGADMKMRVDAFKRYLQNIEKYENLKEATDKFDKFLPWAIALGLDKTFIAKYAAANAPVPDWYQPYPGPVIMQSPYGGYGYPRSHPSSGSAGNFPSKQGRGLPDITGAAQNEGKGVLGGLDSSLSGGLANMSAGLTGMFGAVSTAMTSVPAPAPSSSSGGSWRSSSGGWSSGSSGGWSGGGGSFGGGGSGGGGGGFG